MRGSSTRLRSARWASESTHLAEARAGAQPVEARLQVVEADPPVDEPLHREPAIEMELRDPNKLSIDPRRIVQEQGSRALAEVLASTGYIPQLNTLSDVALALRQFHPILFGGPRGSGKTSLG